MKLLIYYIILLLTVLTAFSCSNEFLNENMEAKNFPTSDYTIFVSPDWEAGDHMFKIPNSGNVDFKITKYPAWLELSSLSGKMTNDFGVVNCKAKLQSDFSEIGIYLDKMEVVVNNEKYFVPIAYVAEGNPSVSMERTINLTFNSYMQPQISIQNIGLGLLFWEITEIPSWMSIDLDAIDPQCFVLYQSQICNIPVKINVESVPSKNFSGKIYLKTNDKENPTIEITVTANLGYPNIYPNTASLIDFGRNDLTKSLYISNQGDGLLVWSIEDLPNWISVDVSNGVLGTYDNKTLKFTCDRNLLPEGLTEAKFYIKSNAVNAPMLQITARTRNGNSSANVKAIEGVVMNAEYDRNTDLLYLSTSQPNKFIAYNSKTRTTEYEISLGKAPTSSTVSEDKKIAAVGHGGQITFINLETKTIAKVYDTGFTVNDIAWGHGDWFCFTKLGGSSSQLVWYNYITNETMESVSTGSGYLDSKTDIGKIPLQPYVLAARRQTSPTGIFVFDVVTRQNKNYRHRSINQFWFSDDGQFTFEDNGNVYKTNLIIADPPSTTDELLPVGKIKFPSDYYASSFKWIDHSTLGKSIWALKKINYDDVSPEILQFEDNDYKFVKTVYSDEIYQLNNMDYTVSPQYVFANGAGNELIVLRLAKEISAWSIEFISVK